MDKTPDVATTFKYHSSTEEGSWLELSSQVWGTMELLPEEAIAFYEFLKPLIGHLYIDAFGPDYFEKLFSELYSKEPDVIRLARTEGHEVIFPRRFAGWYATRLESCSYGPTPEGMTPDPLRYMIENYETGTRIKMDRVNARRIARQLLYMLYNDQESGR